MKFLLPMRALRLLVLGLFALGLSELPATAAAATAKVRVLLVLGGHGFHKEPFWALFDGCPDSTYEIVEHPDVHAMFKPDKARSYDVMVFYDMWDDITAEAKADLVQCLKAGKGLVVLHHAYCSYRNWSEYTEIVGGRFEFVEWTDRAGKHPATSYKHNVDFTVRVTDPLHPVTRGMSDFKIHDETYRNGRVNPGVTPLLTTEEPTSTPTLGWTHRYGQAKVVTLLLGHDTKAYENVNFRRFLHQAIHWVATP
ncbi:MAG: ThuA domain-containing protein [Opitutae bacterium]|nr:ThuA domain-containing protein [Opitutae bacterium]